jgi:hypothetical protein
MDTTIAEKKALAALPDAETIDEDLRGAKVLAVIKPDTWAPDLNEDDAVFFPEKDMSGYVVRTIRQRYRDYIVLLKKKTNIAWPITLQAQYDVEVNYSAYLYDTLTSSESVESCGSLEFDGSTTVPITISFEVDEDEVRDALAANSEANLESILVGLAEDKTSDIELDYSGRDIDLEVESTTFSELESVVDANGNDILSELSDIVL